MRQSFIACAIAGLLLGNTVPAQEDVDPIDAPATETLPDSELLVQMLTELTELRGKVDRLEATLQVFIESVAMPLRMENERLRAQLPEDEYHYEESHPSILDPQSIPRPEPAQTPSISAPAGHDGPITHTLVKEWGRSPQIVAKLGNGITSLKGMVVTVPEWSSDDQLIELGRKLRTQYADYDNINIEVFTDPVSAKKFADSGVAADARDRVLTVSKFSESGRDLILLIRGDSTTTVLP